MNKVKSSLRNKVLTKLTSLPEVRKKQIEKKLSRNLFNSKLWKKANVIGLTCSTEIEWNTMPIIQKAWSEGKGVAVPKTDSTKSTMKFYLIKNEGQLKVGYGNILEPIIELSRFIDKFEIDLLIVPGIVFDKYGYRIGFGGGYYDRFLTNFTNETVSLLSSKQLVDKLPIEKHDINVQYLITETGLYKVKSKSEV